LLLILGLLAVFTALHSLATASHNSSQSRSVKDWTCPMYGFDNYGDTMEKVENVYSWEDCGWLCQNRDGCVIWVWSHDRSGAICDLKNTISDHEEWDASTVAGNKGCFTRC
jgi:PAN domain